VEDPDKANVANHKEPKMCTGCHDHENSPSFVFDTYLAQITGPGHGDYAPASKGKKQSP